MCELCNLQEIEDNIEQEKEELQKVNPKMEFLQTNKSKKQINNIPNKLQGVIMPDKNEFGVENIIKAVEFLGSIGDAIEESLKNDGKVNFADAGNFLKPVINLPGFIGSIPHLPSEFKDTITDDERNEIISALRGTGLDEGKTLEMSIDGFKLAVELKNYFFKYFVKSKVSDAGTNTTEPASA